MLSRRKWPVAAIAIALLIAVSGVSLADTIITKNGETWKGMFIRETEDAVVLDIKGMCQMPIKKANILKWTKAKKSFVLLKTGERYEYFKLVSETAKEIVIKLDGMKENMTIKEDIIKDKYIGPDAKGKDEGKDKKTPAKGGKPKPKAK